MNGLPTGCKTQHKVMTPPDMAQRIIEHFLTPLVNLPYIDVLEPCRGTGSFYNALRKKLVLDSVLWCEIDEGRDFFEYSTPVNWIITNPPFDMVGAWYEYSFRIDGEWTEFQWFNAPGVRELRDATKKPHKRRRRRDGFLEHSFKLADDVVFLLTLHHALGLKSCLKLCDRYGFGIREIILADTPPEPWPQSGFQVGAVHWQRGYYGAWENSDWREGKAQREKRESSTR